MDVSRWWRAFLTTFDLNHDRKCGKSLTFKASWKWNLFHHDSRWMENPTATFWVDCGKTSGENVETRGEKNSWARHHVKSVAHASLVVQQFLAYMNTTVIPYPPYSPGLATCDFFLFAKMKLKLKGWRFDSTEEIQTELQNAMKTLTRNDFQKCFLSWKSSWNRCGNAKGDYFEGEGGE